MRTRYYYLGVLSSMIAQMKFCIHVFDYQVENYFCRRMKFIISVSNWFSRNETCRESVFPIGRIEERRTVILWNALQHWIFFEEIQIQSRDSKQRHPSPRIQNQKTQWYKHYCNFLERKMCPCWCAGAICPRHRIWVHKADFETEDGGRPVQLQGNGQSKLLSQFNGVATIWIVPFVI